jgi:hypothetical protein
MFQPDPILIGSYFKDAPTSPGERGYIAAPGAMTGKEHEPEEEFIRNMDIAQRSESDYMGVKPPGSDDFDHTRVGFIGPTDYESRRVQNDDDEEEDMDM